MKTPVALLLCCTCFTSLAGPGDFDMTFGAGGLVNDSSYFAGGFAIQSDGKILTAGFSYVPPETHVVMARYLPDGALDPAFGIGGKLQGPQGIVIRATVLPDGKILAAGSGPEDAYGSNGFALFRFLADGTEDTAFGTGGRVLKNVGFEHDGASFLAVQNDGKILIGGPSCSNDDDCSITATLTLLRYSASGVPDATFGNGGVLLTGVQGGERSTFGSTFALQADGKIVVLGSEAPNVILKRYDSSGAPDLAFGTGGTVIISRGAYNVPRALTILADQKLLVVGATSTSPYDYSTGAFVRRFTDDGLNDPGFIPDSITTLPYQTGWKAQGLPDGKILIAGESYAGWPDASKAILWRLQENGSIDTGFGEGGVTMFPLGSGGSTIEDIDIQQDGKILLLGANGGSMLARLQSEGPEITAESPAGVNLTSGAATLSFISQFPGGQSRAQTVIVRNTGSEPLQFAAPAVAGPDAASFALSISEPPSALPPGARASFTVTFVPTHTGIASATFAVPNNDANETPFTIALTARAFSVVTDTDGDGLNDWAEVKLAALGFDWQIANPEKVSALSDGAGAAGLYTLNQMQTLKLKTPLLGRDPATGSFRLTVGLEKSGSLSEFQSLPMTGQSTRINAAGNLEFDFTAPEENAFFRIIGRP